VIALIGLALLHRQDELTRLNQTMMLTRDQAEQASNAKGHFLAKTGPEIRSCMNAVSCQDQDRKGFIGHEAFRLATVP
jgi:hypothetical protein